MRDTKENILMTALALFARNGYEAVSVNDIASSIGITKGALYKHYKNKRDIFDSIIKRMYEIDAKRAEEYDVPKEKYEDEPSSYKNTDIENIKKFTIAQFKFWTEDEFASNFRKMLTLEQYRNEEMTELYSNCIVSGPVEYMEDIFREMNKKADARQLAVEYYAVLYLLINMNDCGKTGKEEAVGIIENYVERFIERWGT